MFIGANIEQLEGLTSVHRIIANISLSANTNFDSLDETEHQKLEACILHVKYIYVRFRIVLMRHHLESKAWI